MHADDSCDQNFSNLHRSCERCTVVVKKSLKMTLSCNECDVAVGH